MSDAETNRPDDVPKPPDETWTGLPDVDWYTPESQLQTPPPYGKQYGSYQGQAWGRAPLVNKPKSNLATAILVTLFCCLPFGIVAIVYAAQVDAKWNAGDWHGAERSSRSAKNWALVGVVSGLIFSVIYVLIVAGSTSRSGVRY